MLAKEKMGPLDWDPDIIALTGKVPVTKKKKERKMEKFWRWSVTVTSLHYQEPC